MYIDEAQKEAENKPALVCALQLKILASHSQLNFQYRSDNQVIITLDAADYNFSNKESYSVSTVVVVVAPVFPE